MRDLGGFAVIPDARNRLRRPRRSVSVLGSLVLFAGLLPAAAAAPVLAAPSPNVVISQVYGGGGNANATYTHDYVELFNRGTTSVSLEGWSIQYTSATGTGNFGANTGLITPLSGSVGAGQYILVQESSNAAVGSPLPTPDITDSTAIAMAAGAGKVAVVNTTASLGCNGNSTPCSAAALATIVDLVGYGTGAAGANFFEGAGAAPTISATLADFRAEGGCTDTDNNNLDFASATPAARNSATALHPCTAPDAAPKVDTISPADGEDEAPINANITIAFSESVTTTGTWFDITCSISGTHAATESGTGANRTLDPAVDFVDGDACTVTIFAAGVNDADGNDPPDNMTANFEAHFTAFDVCAHPFDGITPIASIQGSGANAAITGNVTTAGVVVGDFEGGAAISGFYLQDPTGDGDAATSDGIFVFTGGGSANTVTAGELVRVTGFARERFNQTALNGSNSNTVAVPAASIVHCGTGSVDATDVEMPFAAADFPERYEGMLVTFPQSLVISEYFNYDRFGELVLALPLDGEDRPFTGTAVDEPGV